MTEKISYDEYIIEQTRNFLKNYANKWSSILTEDQIKEFTEILDYLCDTYILLSIHSTYEYDKKEYIPNIEPVRVYSLWYEFESLVNEYEDSEELTEEQKLTLKECYQTIYAMLNYWFDHEFGYTLNELEEDMYKNKYGVFTINEVEDE